MSPLLVTILSLGAATGLGVFLLAVGVRAAPPALGPALQRLHSPSSLRAPAGSRQSAAARWLTRELGDSLRPPHKEMRLLGMPMERYVLQKVGYPLAALFYPPLIGALLAMLGVDIPWLAAPLVSLGLAVLVYVLVDVSIRQKAAEAREEFTRAVAVYIGLVALERSAAHGPVESLQRAAQVGTGWVFERLRDALDYARYAGLPPWDGLGRVADEIGVPALRDLADVMRLSGNEGAQVYQTLVSLGQSLRGQLRTKEQDRANSATTLMYIPAAATLMVIFALATFPFIIRLISP